MLWREQGEWVSNLCASGGSNYKMEVSSESRSSYIVNGDYVL